MCLCTVERHERTQPTSGPRGWGKRFPTVEGMSLKLGLRDMTGRGGLNHVGETRGPQLKSVVS
jgi:hypothetical protein